MLLVLIGIGVAYGIFLVIGTWVAPRLALRRHHAQLRAMPVSTLQLEAQRCADVAGMRAQFPAARLFSDESWTRESLVSALDELYAQLAAEDRRDNEIGPGSWVYSWYDSGLASIRETLGDHSV